MCAAVGWRWTYADVAELPEEVLERVIHRLEDEGHRRATGDAGPSYDMDRDPELPTEGR